MRQPRRPMACPSRSLPVLWALLLAALALPLAAQLPVAQLTAGLRWREIGPYRGGRTRAVSGVVQQPNVFYIGSVDGGVWRSNDYGRTWHPIFDHEPTGSIGAIAVAPSDPNIIYVGSGEGLHRPDLATGDGMYKSTDGGQTWTRIGLTGTQQIANVAVDPDNPNRVFVAALGHPYGPNPQRGIFLSTNGGRTWTKVLYKNAYTGGSDVEIDPQNPNIVYASLWQAQEAPWENGAFGGTDGGLFKSTDGGQTWTKLTNGLPKNTQQVDIAIAPSNPSRLYATVAIGNPIEIFRSDDAGASWYRVTTDRRPALRIGGGDIPVPKVDPRNPNVVYTCSTVIWKSVDGGKTWTGLRGAPGGDDYQNLWINPRHPRIMLAGSDQGAIVTVNGGETWSSWYNQPTAQVYHVATDNAFPYHVCSGQQDSGSVCISSRGNWGEITERDWLPVGAEEYATVAPDPLNSNLVFGGKVSRFNWRTDQTADVAPLPLGGKNFRSLRTEPLVFSPVNPKALYFAGNTLWVTTDLGQKWKQISPDLSRKTWTDPRVLGMYRGTRPAKPTRRGVIYAVSPSPLKANLIWAGTDDGLVWVTRDGGAQWTNVTPPGLKPWDKISSIDAGHFSPGAAYIAINTLRLDQMTPRLYRTENYGRTWTAINHGIADNAATDVLRQDPQDRNLLFAGSERQVWVSFNNGGDWHSLRLNMPATSVRDLEIKGSDLIAATHGRGFWILDDITPLRQMQQAAAAQVYLYRPEKTYRVRWDTNSDTPLRPETPAGQNPPDGAILDYYLARPAQGPVTLAVYTAAGELVRRYSSANPPPPINPAKLGVPAYWQRPPQPLLATAGEHRFIWNLHYTPAPGLGRGLPMQAVARDTPFSPNAPWVQPGMYTVKLTADGRTYSQTLRVVMDPRVKTPAAGLRRQFVLSMRMYRGIVRLSAALRRAQALRTRFAALRPRASGAAAAALASASRRLDAVAGRQGRGFFFFFRHPATGAPTLVSLRGSYARLMGVLQSADVTPTTQAAAAVQRHAAQLQPLLARWRAFQRSLPALNQKLQQAGLPAIPLAAGR